MSLAHSSHPVATKCTATVLGIVLAGGRSTRLGGGDKGLLDIGGSTLLARICATLGAQCPLLVLSANGDPARFATLDRPVLADTVPDHPGPLAGVLAGMDYAAATRPAIRHVLTVPGDAPFVPSDLLARLEAQRVATGAAIVQARSGGRTHGVAALWSVGLRADLRQALVEEDLRRVGAFAARHDAATVTWSVEPHDPFLNINTPEDLAAARGLAARLAVA